MGKVIEFRPRETEVNEKLDNLEWWILKVKEPFEKVISGKYTRLDMLDLICCLAAIRNEFANKDTILEAFEARRMEAERRAVK